MSNGKNQENRRFSVKKDFIAHVLIQRIPQLWGQIEETEEETNWKWDGAFQTLSCIV